MEVVPRMAGDWIKLHRQTLDSSVGQDAVTLGIWVALLLGANWAKRELLNGMVLEPGQLVIGQSKFAAQIGVSRQKLRSTLACFERAGSISLASGGHGTTITICHWRTYQNTPNNQQPTANQQPTNQQPTSNQQLTTEEEGKKVRREEGKKGEGEFAPLLGQMLAIKEEHRRAFPHYEHWSSLDEAAAVQRLEAGATVEHLAQAIKGAAADAFLAERNLIEPWRIFGEKDYGRLRANAVREPATADGSKWRTV